MRIRPLFTSTALHAGLVCGMGLWIGTSIGERRRAPARICLTPSSLARTVLVDNAVRESEVVDVERVRNSPVLHEPEVDHEPNFEPAESGFRFESSERIQREFHAAPVEVLARVLLSELVEPTTTEPVTIEPGTVVPAVAQDPVEPQVADPAPKSPVTAWVDAVALDDHNRPPAYPRWSVRMHETGIVDVLVTIDVAGRPSEVELVRASRFPRLNRAAVDAVRRWRFSPAERHGQAVVSTQVVGFEFALADRGEAGATRVR